MLDMCGIDRCDGPGKSEGHLQQKQNLGKMRCCDLNNLGYSKSTDMKLDRIIYSYILSA